MDAIQHFARTHAAALIVGDAFIFLNGMLGVVITVVALGIGMYLNPHRSTDAPRS